VNGQISPIHFISSSAILQNDQLEKFQKARLIEATEAVLVVLEPGLMIFDIDVTAGHDIPVLLYARDGLDLTVEVKWIYEKLSEGTVEFVLAPES
jgi:hypothetical protein